MADQTDTPTPDAPAEGETRKLPDVMPFRHFLAVYRKGTLDDELADALAEVVKAVKLHGKTGQLKLTVKVADTGDSVVTLTHDITTTLPKPDKTPSILFIDDECRLWRDDPNRPGFFDDMERLTVRSTLRVDQPPAGVDPETGEIAPSAEQVVVEARQRFGSR